MARHIRRLDAGNGARAAVVCTTGRYSPRVRDGYEGGALMQARAMLGRRGYDVFLTDVVDYPCSITNVVPPPRPDAVTRIIRESTSAAGAIAARIVRGERGIRPCGWLARAGSFLFGLLYAGAGRFMFGKLYVADGSCDACGVCAHSCPARAIRMAGDRPVWRWRCEGCERCINLCPRASVQLSAARVVLFSVPIFWNPLAGLAIAALPQAPGGALGALIHIAAYSLAVVLLDPVASVMERIPVIRRLFELSWTRGFRRYLAPGFDTKD